MISGGDGGPSFCRAADRETLGAIHLSVFPFSKVEQYRCLEVAYCVTITLLWTMSSLAPYGWNLPCTYVTGRVQQLHRKPGYVIFSYVSYPDLLLENPWCTSCVSTVVKCLSVFGAASSNSIQYIRHSQPTHLSIHLFNFTNVVNCVNFINLLNSYCQL